jgi:hypothetical protein
MDSDNMAGVEADWRKTPNQSGSGFRAEGLGHTSKGLGRCPALSQILWSHREIHFTFVPESSTFDIFDVSFVADFSAVRSA